MDNKLTLFREEELVLQKAKAVVEQFKDQDMVPLDAFKQLFNNYQKLLRQTKFLIKMSDKQQNYLTHLAESVEMKNQDLIRINQEKNAFLGIAIHDLKSPLCAIQGAIDLLQEDNLKLSKEELNQWFNVIKQASVQTLDSVRNYLDIHIIESGQLHLSLAHIDLLPIVKVLVGHYRPFANVKQLSLHLRTVEEQYIVYIDQNMFYQILENLVSNAIKYSPPGKDIHVLMFEENQQVHCEVRDEGPGLSESEQQQLFQKFVPLSSQPTGGEDSTGLGLFIAKKFVDTMNGKIWCECEEKKGAKFIVTFPMSPKKT